MRVWVCGNLSIVVVDFGFELMDSWSAERTLLDAERETFGQFESDLHSAVELGMAFAITITDV